MTPKQRQVKQQLLEGAMSGLVLDQRFGEFIDLMRDHQDAAVADLCTEAVLKCPRATLTTIGEIKHYRQLIATYEEFLARAEEPVQEQSLQ